jgi:hypothetical protein
MKRLLLFGLGTISLFSSFAQSNKEDIDMVQAIYGKQKKEIVAGFIMPPDSAKTVAFWNLYDAYETERKAFGQKRIALLDKYANAYSSLDDKITDEITTESIALASGLEGLLKTYYGKIKKAVGVKQAAQFFQIEGYLLSATRVYIMGNIPFIDELEKLPVPAAPAKQ